MATVEPWRFEQQGGARRVLILAGYAAPFGRPRRDPVATEETKLRQNARKYPGNDKVTRQIYGFAQESIELHGRWMDKALGGIGSARNQVIEMETFVRAAQPISVTWGNAIAFLGQITSFTKSWEGQHDCAWKLTIDQDELIDQQTSTLAPAKAPTQYAALIREVFSMVFESIEPTRNGESDAPVKLKLGFVDSLGTAVSQLLAPVAQIEAAANELKSLKDGTIGQIRKFRAGLTMFQRAVSTVLSVIEETPNDAALEVSSARSQLSWQTFQASFGATVALALADVAEADRAARQAVRLKIRDIFSARQGDTWESLSTTIYGDASRSQALSEANDMGVEPPIPGETYIAPV